MNAAALKLGTFRTGQNLIPGASGFFPFVYQKMLIKSVNTR
jgi:hypothetical protein